MHKSSANLLKGKPNTPAEPIDIVWQFDIDGKFAGLPFDINQFKKIYVDKNNYVKIWWGDGTTSSFDKSTIQITDNDLCHEYAISGKYTIIIENKDYILSTLNKDAINSNSANYFRDNTLSISPFFGSIFRVDENSQLIRETSASYYFYGCKKITEIPENLFSSDTHYISTNNDNITVYDNCFSNITTLTSIPENLFKNVSSLRECFFNTRITNVPKFFANITNDENIDFSRMFESCSNLETLANDIFITETKNDSVNFDSLFRSCVKLINIPENLFSTLTSRNFTNTFKGSSISSIPENLFKNAINALSFQDTFSNCLNLLSIPENLFKNNIKSISFYNCFASSALTSIPSALFSSCPDVENFNSTFSGCRRLKVIPENLFANNLKVNTYNNCFINCANLETLPESIFGTTQRTISCSLNSFLQGTKISSVSNNIFNVLKVNGAKQLFNGCNYLITIPENLFETFQEVTDFSDTFSACASFTTIPENLFSNCVMATTFDRTFQDFQGSSIPENLFKNCISATSFISCFRNSKITSIPKTTFQLENTINVNSLLKSCTSLLDDVWIISSGVSDNEFFASGVNNPEKFLYVKEDYYDMFASLSETDLGKMQLTKCYQLTYNYQDINGGNKSTSDFLGYNKEIPEFIPPIVDDKIFNGWIDGISPEAKNVDIKLKSIYQDSTNTITIELADTCDYIDMLQFTIWGNIGTTLFKYISPGNFAKDSMTKVVSEFPFDLSTYNNTPVTVSVSVRPIVHITYANSLIYIMSFAVDYNGTYVVNKQQLANIFTITGNPSPTSWTYSIDGGEQDISITEDFFKINNITKNITISGSSRSG